jgi:hypothetical protein
LGIEADMRQHGRSSCATQSVRRRLSPTLLAPLALLTLCGCGHWSWNPFKKQPEPPPPAVEMLSIESRSPNPASDRFTQSWEGVRLMVDVYSDTGIGRAVLKPRDQGWPLRLAFRLHLAALEGFEVRAAQNLRWDLGHEPLTEPAVIDLPAGAYTKESPEIEIQWVDHYR